MAATLVTFPHPHKPVLALTWQRGGFYIAFVKWRNQLLALCCLIVFFGFGVLYFRYWVIQKPFGIILFIAGGLDTHHLAAARLHARSTEQTLAIDGLPYTALLRNSSANSPTADFAAAATAFSTGAKVNNGAIAVDPEGKQLSSLLDLARDSGRMTGLVTNGRLTNATTASFYGHATTQSEQAALAQQLVKRGDLDVVLGAGTQDFTPPSQESDSTEKPDLLSRLAEDGYEVVRSLADLDEIPRWRRAKLFGLFTDDELASAIVIQSEEGGDAIDEQPTLAAVVRRAIELLQFNRGGYLLVVDSALMRKAAFEKNDEAMIVQTLHLDRAIKVALEYAGAKSAVFVCADVALRKPPETEAATNQTLEPVAGKDPAELQSLPAETASPVVPPSVVEATSSPSTLAETTAVTSTSPNPIGARSVIAASTSAEDVIAFGKGLGADPLHGVMENTAVFEIIVDNL